MIPWNRFAIVFPYESYTSDTRKKIAASGALAAFLFPAASNGLY
jgi:hypothetical protein